MDGLLTALHIQLAHPTSHQLKAVIKWYLYALDMDLAVECVSDGCCACSALRRSPSSKVEQSMSLPPDAVGVSFAADVLKGSCQLILVLREAVTSSTQTGTILRPVTATLSSLWNPPAITLGSLLGPGCVEHHIV